MTNVTTNLKEDKVEAKKSSKLEKKSKKKQVFLMIKSLLLGMI